MKVMYLAPRFHTNQAAMIKGWQEHGDQTMFVVRRIGKLEDYSVEKPVLLPYASSFRFLYRIYNAVHRKNEYAHDFDLRFGYPSAKDFKRILSEFHPDLVIVREKSIYSMACYRILKKKNICAVLYNQSPAYVEEKDLHRDWKHKMVDRRLPQFRITPVLKTCYLETKKLVHTANSYFVPFVAEPICSPESKKWFPEGYIRILEVGKFETRKNHILLLDAFEKLLKIEPNLRLTIVGEVSNDFHKAYLETVMQKINNSDLLKTNVRIMTNIPHNEMNAVYQSSDLYVLPSTGEPAAYSILEAMANCVPAICSTGNGTASYIKPGITGDIFLDNSMESLYEKIIQCIQDREKLKILGNNAYFSIVKNYTFNNYYNNLIKIPEIDRLLFNEQ